MIELGYETAKPVHGARITEHLVSLMRIFEAFTLDCFGKRAPFFVDSGTLLGCVRHNGIIPWDNDINVAMLRPDFHRYLEGFTSDRLILDRYGYGDPDGCVWMRDAASGDAGLDLSSYDVDGTSHVAESIQRTWPLDAWGPRRSEGSWRYDFGHTLEDLVWLPSFAGPVQAPARWLERLERHYDDMSMAPELREQATNELGFDPGLPPVTPVKAYASLEEGLRATKGLEPFEVPACTGFDLDAQRIEAALRAEPRPLCAYHPSSGLRFDPIEITGADAARRMADGTLDVAIFDSRASLPLHVIPEPLRRPTPGEHHFPFQLGYVVSPARSETLFHSDGPCHTYNFITTGEKWWWFVEPVDADPTILPQMSITEILTGDRFRRWGRVRIARQRTGTLIVFPGRWPHRVLTREPALGVAGYIYLAPEQWS